jgi:hypothetical protein
VHRQAYRPRLPVTVVADQLDEAVRVGRRRAGTDFGLNVRDRLCVEEGSFHMFQ